MKKLLFLLLISSSFAFGQSDTSMYFPPINNSEWATIAPESLNWNIKNLTALLDFLEQKNTSSFLILVNGRIVVEKYFGAQKVDSDHPWNSAGKTLVSAVVGIAQQENLLNINSKVFMFLGKGWANEPWEKIKEISIRNLLTMTSGIDNSSQIIRKRNLTYRADAGTRWAYHNVFQKLMEVIEEASEKKFENYFNEKLKNKIGMEGYWRNGLIFRIYHSNARSMARFGILALNNGTWQNEQIINKRYFNESINSSQELNPAYGFFWWLNGKDKYMLPGSEQVFKGPLIPNAPADMYAAMGAADQRLYVIPSKKMIIIRMGEASNKRNPSFALSGFDNELWEKINEVIK